MNTRVKTIWTSIRFEIAPDQEDLACWLMIDLGAKGCEIERASDFTFVVKAYFENEEAGMLDTVALKLEEYGLGKALSSLVHEDVVEQDWLKKWKTAFKAFPVGEKFVVCPAWEADQPQDEPSRLKIVIDPGMAFGTGLHTTTQFCMHIVEKGLPQGPILDVGTGSGILAIAAALLDKRAQILAIDNDATALENAALNLKLNGVSSQVELLLAEPEKIEGKFSTILSNMTCEDIVALLPAYKRLLRAGGIVVGAGILKEKMPLLQKASQEDGFVVSHRQEKGEWMGVVLTAD